MAGQRQKPREELAFKRGGRDRVAEATPEGMTVPSLDMPPGLRPDAQWVWQQTIPLVMKFLVPTDFPIVHRWIYYVNEFMATAELLALEGPIVEQQYGTVLNPRARWLQQLEGNIFRIEGTLGLNPQARMRLGITHAAEQTALEKLRGGRSDRPKPTPMSFPKAAATT